MTPALTLFALVAFAANSVLCRLALGHAAADPASFTLVRLLSGAIALALIGASSKARRSPAPRSLHWIPATLLFLYAAGRSRSGSCSRRC